ncbi:MAG: acylphosphatase [Streptosporangiaceae bacterium]
MQGLGFRPFVYSLASRLGLAGFVGNDLDVVLAEAEGPPDAVAAFLTALRADPPPMASIDRIDAAEIPPTGATAFAIVPSEAGGERRALISAGTATCTDCLADLADPADRRFGYPSSTAPTAGRGSRSSGESPTTGH